MSSLPYASPDSLCGGGGGGYGGGAATRQRIRSFKLEPIIQNWRAEGNEQPDVAALIPLRATRGLIEDGGLGGKRKKQAGTAQRISVIITSQKTLALRRLTQVGAQFLMSKCCGSNYWMTGGPRLWGVLQIRLGYESEIEASGCVRKGMVQLEQGCQFTRSMSLEVGNLNNNYQCHQS